MKKTEKKETYRIVLKGTPEGISFNGNVFNVVVLAENLTEKQAIYQMKAMNKADRPKGSWLEIEKENKDFL